MTSKVSLYTENFYKANKDAIDASATVGNVAELFEVANYVFISVKTATWQSDPLDDTLVIESPVMNEPAIQANLAQLVAGTVERYELSTVEDFLLLDDMQLYAGSQYDPYRFERWFDSSLGKHRWRLILTRTNTNALSIKVYKNGAYWYTPGAFIDQGDGTWLINSWDGGATETPEDATYEFISGSQAISQLLTVQANVDVFNSNIAYN